MRKWIVAFGAVLAIIAVSTSFWMTAPLESGQAEKPDPMVAYLNASLGSKNYRELYVADLHAVLAGEGELVVLLHGFPSNWYSLIRPMERLRENHQVLAIDGLGVGLSAAPSELDAYTLDSMAKRVLSVVDELGVSSFHLVGHDWGAVFAFSLAQAYPDRVRSVVGISGAPLSTLLDVVSKDANERERFSYIEKLKIANPLLVLLTGGRSRVTSVYENLHDAQHLSSAEKSMFVAAVSDARRIDAHINWYRANIPAPKDIVPGSYWPEGTDDGARIVAPSMLIYGERDPIMSDLLVENIEKIADQMMVLSIPDVGHWPQFEASVEVTEAIRKFIADVERHGKELR